MSLKALFTTNVIDDVDFKESTRVSLCLRGTLLSGKLEHVGLIKWSQSQISFSRVLFRDQCVHTVYMFIIIGPKGLLEVQQLKHKHTLQKGALHKWFSCLSLKYFFHETE